MQRSFRHLRTFLAFFLLSCAFPALFAQQTFPQAAPSDPKEGLVAFTNATIYSDYKTHLDGATLLIRKGKVVDCGLKVAIPAGAVVIDCTGKTIYPSFIDLYATNYGLPAEKTPPFSFGQPPQYNAAKKGAYAWNDALNPEFKAAENFSNEPKEAEAFRNLGFGAVLTHNADGIARGTGVVVALADDPEQETILLETASNHLSFRKGTSRQNYPSSLMGCIALLRQTYLDAQWYKAEGYKVEKNLSLEAWNREQNLPQIFEAADKLDVLRIQTLGKEFGVNFMVKTAGDEYQRLEAVKATGQTLIVPLVFPDAADVDDPYDALNVSLSQLKHWEMAPSNAAMLENAGVRFALTTNGLKDKKMFWTALRKAIDYGLTPQQALKALTYEPAQLLHLYDTDGGVGSLSAGKQGNFFICTGDVFDKESKILENWVLGKPYQVSSLNNDGVDLSGTYQLQAGADAFVLTVKGKPEAPEASLMRADSSTIKASLSYDKGLVTLMYQADTLKKEKVLLSGVAGKANWSGRGTLADGSWINWSAERKGDAAPGKPKKEKPEEKPETGQMIYPFTAYGWQDAPKQATFLIRNAEVWTGEKQGKLSNTDVLISEGKIRKIGRNLPVQDNATVVDGTGKYLTAGIIDEHSHIAVARSVNEGTQESSAEVRIGDALDSEDINIYRQLAGGVTSSHLLHGSANPIGGQTQLIKLRWGVAPEALKFEAWPGQIKFALGENVKQSNWGDNNRSRYPQTRMGVEQVYVDYFTRAREYGAVKKSGKPYRKDLEMEALLEILESKRFITCHSYVQSEITMLMRVAERFGFKVNTFTHILEGYKVADKMAKHGAGGSTFSDWWDYKFEVYQAIPYNAAIMQEQGVTVAINSDDAEMARRLNQEAAKTMEYGGVPEQEAWKMVTLNPAKLLHVDNRVGSIKEGKDADLVLWNANPLTVYASAEKTWVDGVPYFDAATDAQEREWVRKERARLIQKMLAAKKGSGGGERPGPPRQLYHCDSDEDEG